MANLRLASLLALPALLFSNFSNANPIVKESRQTQACVNATFSNAQLPQGVSIFIERVESVAKGNTFKREPTNIAWTSDATNLPALCAAIINVTDKSVTPQSNYRFGIFLPNNWNSRILTIGSESFAGGINWPGMAEGVNYNMTTISTDNGHNSIPGDLSWGLRNDAGLFDWGYRAVHGSVVIAKILTKKYYNANISHSYYSGCSTGGRQGLKEIQISPDSFDGALIGAPAWDTKYLMPRLTRIAYDTLQVGAADRLDANGYAALFTLLNNAVKFCDSIDGVSDGIVSMPEKCNIESLLSQSLCGNGQQLPNCLTEKQAQIARNIYGDYITSDGTFIQSGFLPTSEIGWFTWVFPDDVTGFDGDYERYFLLNATNWSTSQYSDAIALQSIATNPGQATADKFDISSFQARGGKIIMYHGMADGTVPTKTSEYYYNQTQKNMPAGTKMDDFFRYFQIPGMSHCWNNASTDNQNAPWMIGGYGQANAIKGTFHEGYSVPGHRNDPNYDAFAALIQWTEGGAAADQIIATKWNSTTEARTRPICKWPNYAKLKTGANIDKASSWSCVAPN